jgi:hypothetical protein
MFRAIISDNEIYLLIKYIKSILWRVAKRLSYIEDARCLKVRPKLLHPLQNSPSVVPVLSQINPVHVLQAGFSSISILSSHLCPDLTGGLSSSCFVIRKLYTPLLSSPPDVSKAPTTSFFWI